MMIFCLLLAALSSTVFSTEWKASVVKQLEVLQTSCAVIPCSFTYPKDQPPSSSHRAIWHLKKSREERIYHDDRTLIMESFRGRTKLLGHLTQGNCSLEITDIKDHDNGPFCFRIELADSHKSTAGKFSFVEDCVEFTILPEPRKPELSHHETATQGRPFAVTSTIVHTCPSHPPTLTWSRGTSDDITVTRREIHPGHWEVQSVLTLIPEVKDDHSEISCTAQFNGQKTSAGKMSLFVKRVENYNHIIIPAVVGIGTAAIFAGFCIFMVKKYKKRIAELQSRDGSMWNRLSRLSRRIRPDGPAVSRSDQRRSIWSRFSRRPRGDMGMSDMGGNVNSKSCADQKFSKPRFPSPKSQPKSNNFKEDLDDGDDYVNTADLNVYGNI